MKITEKDLHPHLKTRMAQRGVTDADIEETMNKGAAADDAKEGTFGKVHVFPYNKEWEGHTFEEKEVRVYYKQAAQEIILLTVKARYGKF